MKAAHSGPFENIESAHEYVGLLLEALTDRVTQGEFDIHQGGQRVSDPNRVRQMMGGVLEPCLQRLARFAMLTP